MNLKIEAVALDYTAIARTIRNATRFIVLSGAGISTPSGIPDFRTDGAGLWSRFEPMEYASLSAFRTQPEKFFQWVRPLFREISSARPNPAHLALAELERLGLNLTIITQNIDGLHQKAGSTRVIEVHGSIRTLTCTCCFRTYESQSFLRDFLDNEQMPVCPHCHNLLKPDTILFQEQLPRQPWLAAQQAAQECDLMMVVGSSLEVLPIAGLPMKAINNGARLIVLNNTPTYLDQSATHVLNEDLAIALPRIAHELH